MESDQTMQDAPRIEDDEWESSLLLALPDDCLLKVLQCCAADDQRSLFSAARAHSRLRQAAGEALPSIRADISKQRQVLCLRQYLNKHGQHVDSIALTATSFEWRKPVIIIRQLSPSVKLSSLQLAGFKLQLQPQPGSNFLGVLPVGVVDTVAALQQLQLDYCELLDGDSLREWKSGGTALSASLSQLSGLQHLSIHKLLGMGKFPTGVLSQLQQLTYLQLAGMELQGPDRITSPLQPIQTMTRLVDLRLHSFQGQARYGGGPLMITRSLLAGCQHLTRLTLGDGVYFEPGVLAGKTKLQHLDLSYQDPALAFGRDPERTREGGILPPGPRDGAPVAAVSQLLSHLQDLQQLTYLGLESRLLEAEENNPPAAAYAALTASSKLQHLDISCGSYLPAGVWQYMFPAGRQLPHLTFVDLNCASSESLRDSAESMPDGSRLVSCCPGLRALYMSGLPYTAKLIAPLQGLSGLHCLELRDAQDSEIELEHLEAVCHLTGLRELNLQHRNTDWKLLQLTQLKQLTALHYEGRWTLKDHACTRAKLECKAPGDEPVWRQVLRLHLDHSDPAVAQQAAAALAE